MKDTEQTAADEQLLWQEYSVRPSPRLREELIHRYRPLAQSAARRICRFYDEDVEQVALLGLIRAIDRFDPSRDNVFSTFAVPTIVGEVCHYLRDCSRLIRYPRALHDLRLKLRSTEAELARASGQTPTLAELAEALNVEIEEITEVMAAEEHCRPRSLDARLGSSGDDDPWTLQEHLGERDWKLERVETEIAWAQILDQLGPQLKRVIQLRYFQGLTQLEASRALHCSQMHVSRLERQALVRLRAQVAV
jgi:RNA polymerase sigma-B factor